MITETDRGTGAIPDHADNRDLHWGHEIGMIGEPFDWKKGYDIEDELRDVLNNSKFKLPVNDQNGSGSCGGQAASKKGEAISAIANGVFKRKSAKYPYAQVFVPPAGSAGRELCRIATQQGFGNEVDTLSYENGKPPTEAFMQRKQDITEIAVKNAGIDKAFAYADVAINIESVAQAIRDTKGVIIGIAGQNNGTWRTKFPKPPTTENPDDVWRHWVYAGKAKIINGKKYIGFINSWGEDTGDDGWQWIGEDYFKSVFGGVYKSQGIFNVWTMVYNIWGDTKLFDRVLRYRNRGSDVAKLQELLGIHNDGIFGSITLRSVKNFQTKYGLKPDGIVGPKTQDKLLEIFKK